MLPKMRREMLHEPLVKSSILHEPLVQLH